MEDFLGIYGHLGFLKKNWHTTLSFVGRQIPSPFYCFRSKRVDRCLKKNQSTPRPSEHPPVMGEKMSKRLGGIKGCK